ncbi:hypothetical protein ACTFBW_22965 [Aeromonas rivipollensis]
MKALKETSSSDIITPFAGYVTADMQKQKIDDVTRYFIWLGDLSLEGRFINDPFYTLMGSAMEDLKDRLDALKVREGANKRGNSSRLTQSFHFFSLSRFFLP